MCVCVCVCVCARVRACVRACVCASIHIESSSNESKRNLFNVQFCLFRVNLFDKNPEYWDVKLVLRENETVFTLILW